MPRIPRSLIKEANRCYHLTSRTVGQEFLLGEVEKEHLMRRIKMLSAVYFVKVFSFCVLSNHFHLLIQMRSDEDYSDEEIERRFRIYYGPKPSFPKEKIAHFRKKWADLSEYGKEIKQGFSRWYNKLNNRKGCFWSERFSCTVVEDGPALLNCMAYIDLNAVRANLVDRPEDYRFCGLGFRIQSGNRDDFLSLDLSELSSDESSSLSSYRTFVYEMGSLERADGKRQIPTSTLEQEGRSDYLIKRSALFRYRSRYFTEGVVLGSKMYVREVYARLQPYLKTRQDRNPVRIDSYSSLFSLRRLRQSIQ